MIRLLFLLLLLSPSVAFANDSGPVRWTQVATATSPVNDAAKNAVKVMFPAGRGYQSGSGAYLGDRYVLTAWHVPEGTSLQGKVVFQDGTEIPCKVNGADKHWDQCVLTLDREHPTLPGVDFATENPKVGETVYSCGFGAGFRIFGGRVTDFASKTGTPPTDWLNHQSAAIPGDSGGPMFTTDGKLIGPLWGRGSNRTIGTTTGRCVKFCEPLLQTLANWKARRRGCPPGVTCPPNSGNGGPTPVDPGPSLPGDELPPANPPESGCDCDQEKLIADLMDKIKGDPLFRGQKGDQGPKGEPGEKGPKGDKGDPGEVTDEHLAAIVAAVVESVKSDPSMKGPRGKRGKPGKDAVIDLDALAIAVAERMPGQRVILVDGKTGKKIDDETYAPGKPIVLDVQRIVNSASAKSK